jgi:CheY-like chemotaxis protein
VLRNLVSNAIKYTRHGWVQLRCLHEQACVRIEVLDTGIGIQPDQLDHIYEEFYQVGVSPNTARDGYGLGLSIVQRVVRLLDLKLDVTSEVGKGSKFSLTVPASSNRMLGIANGVVDLRSTQNARTLRPRVLLVEDDAAVRGATRMLLKVEGYRVTEAASVLEAVAQARVHRDIELLITDYHLGGEDTGMDAIAAVRAELKRGIKAALVTGDTSAAVRDLNHDVNTRIVSKPINANEFLALLAELQA